MPRVLASRPVQRLMRPLRDHLNRHSTRVARREAEVVRAQLHAEIARLRSTVADLRATVAELSEAAAQNDVPDVPTLPGNARFTLELLLGPQGRDAARLVSEDEVNSVIAGLQFAGDRSDVVVAVHQAFRSLVEIESRSVGRFPGSTTGNLAMLAGIALLRPPSGDVATCGDSDGTIEVGVARQVSRVGRDVRLTIFTRPASSRSPLDESGSPDEAESALRQVVEANLELGGLAPSAVRFLQGVFEAAEPSSIARDRRYGLVVIGRGRDADDVESDLRWADESTLLGGVVVLLGYGDPGRPGVAGSVDRHVNRPGALLELVGATGTVAFLRARQTPIRPALSSELERNVYERESLAFLDESALVAAVMPPHATVDGVMVDVGAHHGTAFRRFHKAGWKIFAFEPDPRHSAFLTEHYDEVERVILDSRAVSNKSGEQLTFYASEESPGISGLLAFRESHVPIADVETVALRDVPSIGRVDLLKVDTEGYELYVLEGFPWDRVQPSVVVAEFEDHKTKLLGYCTSDLIDYLNARGYQVWVSEWHPIIRYGTRHHWHRLVNAESCTPDPEAWGNLIGFRNRISSDEMGRALASVLSLG